MEAICSFERSGSYKLHGITGQKYRCDNLKPNLLFVISKRPVGSVVYSAVRSCKIHGVLCVIKSTVVSLHWNITSNFSHEPFLALPRDYYTHCELSNFTSVSQRSFRHKNRQPATLIPHEAYSTFCAGSLLYFKMYFLSTLEFARGRAYNKCGENKVYASLWDCRTWKGWRHIGGAGVYGGKYWQRERDSGLPSDRLLDDCEH
jgi:hypothetical protein